MKGELKIVGILVGLVLFFVVLYSMSKVIFWFLLVLFALSLWAITLKRKENLKEEVKADGEK